MWLVAFGGELFGVESLDVDVDAGKSTVLLNMILVGSADLGIAGTSAGARNWVPSNAGVDLVKSGCWRGANVPMASECAGLGIFSREAVRLCCAFFGGIGGGAGEASGVVSAW